MANIGGGRAETRCDHCGQVDDHPKAHIGLATKHHDCLSFDDKALLTNSGQDKGAPKASAVIEACESGARGADLLALIVSGDLAQATGKGGRVFDEGEK